MVGGKKEKRKSLVNGFPESICVGKEERERETRKKNPTLFPKKKKIRDVNKKTSRKFSILFRTRREGRGRKRRGRRMWQKRRERKRQHFFFWKLR